MALEFFYCLGIGVRTLFMPTSVIIRYMSGTFTKRDHEASREVTRLFWRANFVDGNNFIIWLLTRPLGLLIYNVLIPFQIAYALQAIIMRDFDSVWGYAWVILGMGIAYCVLWAVGGVAICQNGKVATVWIQREVFVNYLKKDYEFLNNTYLGALGAQAARLRDAFNDYCALVMNSAVRLGVVIIASIAIIAYHSWLLALVTIVSMIIILSFTIASSRWRLKYRRLLSESNSELSGIIGDALSQGVTVKSFAAEEYETSRLDTSLDKLGHHQFWSWASSIPADVGRLFLAAVAMVILLLLTSQLYQQNTIPIAIVVLVQLYVVRLVMATNEIADTIKGYESIMSTAHAAVKTMLVKSTIVDPEHPKKIPSPAKLTLSLEDVTYRYPEASEGTAAVDHFTLDIQEGEKVGLVGYSGSGKTTLTKLLLRFVDVSSGAIKLSGVDIRDVAQSDVRRHIGYVPQEPLLFHRTIRENIAYGNPAASQKEILEAAKMAYVDEFIGEMTNGYDTVVGEKGVKLSGGQRQRVAIARALLKDAPFLVLDEATSALDSKSEQYIQKALWKLMKGRTAIVIAHRLSTIQKMDRIVVMDKGRIVATGTHVELLKDAKGIYAKLWAHQSGGYIGKPIGSSEDDSSE